MVNYSKTTIYCKGSQYICIEMISEAKQVRILVCPLDWGLGHATRCIPIIRELQTAGAKVVIAADGPQLKLLQTEFPELEWVRFPGYEVTYRKTGMSALKLLLDLPGLFFKVIQEHFRVKSLIKKLRIDAIISDNRYGLWNRNITNVFLTHQLNIIAPPPFEFAEPLLRSVVRYFAGKFNLCWIPDVEGADKLSGRLSHGYITPSNIRYIGLLSRFDKINTIIPDKLYQIVAIVSGPEPQRGIFENKLLSQLPVEGCNCLLIRGLPGDTGITNVRSNLDIADHLASDMLAGILSTKPIVISRSGYSTLMDIAYTGNKAILIPTPGQTEQEYLADSLEKKGYYFSCKQDSIDLEKAIEFLENTDIKPPNPAIPEYKTAIHEFLEQIKSR